MEQVTIVKVVSRNFFLDFVSKFQNMVGLNLTSYEKMIQKAVNEIQQEIKEKKIKLKWFRYETSQLTNGAMSVMLYGERK